MSDTAPNMKPRRSAGKSALLTLLAVLLGLALVELGFRGAGWLSGADWKPSPYDKIFFHPKPPGWEKAVPETKPNGVFRIVVLGESTARGWPYGTEAAFPAWVAAALDDPAGPPRVEVINLGMDSLDSDDFVEMMGALAAKPVDLFLIYSGHNEYSGHYLLDAPTPFRRKMEALRDAMVHHSKAAQFLRHKTQEMKRAAFLSNQTAILLLLNKEFLFNHDADRALARFPFPEEIRATIRDHWLENVSRLIALAGRGRILFVVPSSNVTDIAPIRSPLSFERLMRANCEWEKDTPGCRRQQARDLLASEAVMHRLPPDFADALREKLERAGIPFVEAGLDKDQLGCWPDCPERWFLDFVHPTVEGHRRIALALLPEIAKRAGLAVDETASNARWEAMAADLASRLNRAELERPIPRGIGWFYLLFGDAQQALPYLEQGARDMPEDALSHLILAMGYQRLGRLEEARKSARQAWQKDAAALDSFFGSCEKFEREWLTD